MTSYGQFIVSPVVGFLGTPFSRQVALSPRDYLNLPSLGAIHKGRPQPRGEGG